MRFQTSSASLSLLLMFFARKPYYWSFDLEVCASTPYTQPTVPAPCLAHHGVGRALTHFTCGLGFKDGAGCLRALALAKLEHKLLSRSDNQQVTIGDSC